MKRECESCIKRKTTYCPTYIECMATDDMPYYQNRIMLLEENQQLKDNWNELMEDIPHILEMIEHNKDVIKVTSDEELAIYSLQNKMQEIEQGSDSDE